MQVRLKMSANCKLNFSFICLGGVVISILVVAVELLSTSASDWSNVVTDGHTYKFGVFTSSVTIGNRIVASTARSSLICVQAMLVVGILLSITGTITLFISGLQLRSLKREPIFFFVLSLMLFFMSAVMYIVGLSVYTNDWNHHNKAMFSGTLDGAKYSHGYSFYIAWLAFVFSIFLCAYLIMGYYFIKDRMQIEYDDDVSESEKLVRRPLEEEDVAAATEVVEETVEEAVAEAEDKLHQ